MQAEGEEQGFPAFTLGTVVEVTNDFAVGYFFVAGFIVIGIFFKFASDTFKLALFEAVPAFLQSIVEYHLLPPSLLSDARRSFLPSFRVPRLAGMLPCAARGGAMFSSGHYRKNKTFSGWNNGSA